MIFVQERKEKMKADVALVHSIPEMCNFRNWSPDDSPAFSMDDFEGKDSFRRVLHNMSRTCMLISWW